MRAGSRKDIQTVIPVQTKAAQRATVASSPQLEVRRGSSVSLAMSSEAWMQKALTSKPNAQTGHSLTVTVSQLVGAILWLSFMLQHSLGMPCPCGHACEPSPSVC